MRVDAVIAGDPSRARLAQEVKDSLLRCRHIGKVLLMFKRNPAKAFNEGAKLCSSDRVLFIGGDVFIDEGSIGRLLAEEADVVYGISGPIPRNAEFVSGVFVAKRELMLREPMPERPDFLEEVYWYRRLRPRISFKPVRINFEHRQVHSFSHKVFRRYARAKARIILDKGPLGKALLPFAFIKIFLEAVVR